MKIAVMGLDHLGAVTSACLEKMGHEVFSFDNDDEKIKRFLIDADSIEPGLMKILWYRVSIAYLMDQIERIKDCDIVWICYDTPVAEDGTGNVAWVTSMITEEIIPHIGDNTVLLISSQVPVGTTETIQTYLKDIHPELQNVHVAYSPENLRHGSAARVFLEPDRIVVGTKNEQAQAIIHKMFQPLGATILWTGIKEAEMIKHAINCFLATEIAFINEIDTICQKLGIDSSQVELGLKTDQRIGKLAYLKPGGPYTHKTLGRDMAYLLRYGVNVALPLLAGVDASNERRKRETNEVDSHK